MSAAARIAEIQSELATLGGVQERQLAQALAAAEEAALAVASDDSPARRSVKNEARRIALLLQQQRPGFNRILRTGQ